MSEDTICRREVYLSAIANGEGSGSLPEPICREEVFLKQIAENGVSGGGGGTTTEKITVVEVSGSTHTIAPNKHYVITGVTNSLKITLSEAITTELKKYSFEFSTIDRLPTLTISGVSLPIDLQFEKYTKYLCEIVNNKLVIRGAYDGFPYTFVYGLYASSDFATSYNLKNDRTVITTVNSATKNGTYKVEENGSTYLVTITYEDSSVEILTYNNGTLTLNGTVYTKI